MLWRVNRKAFHAEGTPNKGQRKGNSWCVPETDGGQWDGVGDEVAQPETRE